MWQKWTAEQKLLLSIFHEKEKFLVFSNERGIEVARWWYYGWHSDSGANLTQKVTHFMPLPSKPQKEG